MIVLFILLAYNILKTILKVLFCVMGLTLLTLGSVAMVLLTMSFRSEYSIFEYTFEYAVWMIQAGIFVILGFGILYMLFRKKKKKKVNTSLSDKLTSSSNENYQFQGFTPEFEHWVETKLDKESD